MGSSSFYSRGVKPVIHGTKLPIFQQREWDHDPVRGIIFHETFEGAGDNMSAMASSLIFQKVAFRWDQSAIKSRITATYSGPQGAIPDEAVPVWQLVPNEAHISVLKSQRVRSADEAWPEDIDSDELGFSGTLQAAVTAHQSGDTDKLKELRDAVPPSLLGDFDLVLGWLVRGETHFAISQPVLRRTYSVSNSFQGNLGGQQGVNRLRTMNSILGLPLPTVVRAQIGSIASGDSHTGYAWSWLEKGTQLVTSAQNRSEVSTEWWWDEWNSNLYGDPS